MGATQAIGILDANEKLAEKAWLNFVQEVKDELNGIDAGILPCNDPLITVPYADLMDLENKEKFPTFHEIWRNLYEAIAKALNVDNNFSIAPIFDPLAVICQLKIPLPDIEFGLFLPSPDFLIQLDIPPIDIPLKLLELPIKIPPELPSFNFKLPDISLDLIFNLKLDLPNLGKMFLDLALALPKLLLDLVLKVLLILPKLPDVGAFFCAIYKEIKDSLFSALQVDILKNFVHAAALKVMIKKIAEMLSAAMISLTVGAASCFDADGNPTPAGIAGLLGTAYGYFPPKQKKSGGGGSKPDRMKKAANDSVGSSYAITSVKITKQDGSEETVNDGTSRKKYVDFLFAKDEQSDRIKFGESVPSTGPFIAALLRAGESKESVAVDPYATVISKFTQPDKTEQFIVSTIELAKKHGVLLAEEGAGEIDASGYDSKCVVVLTKLDDGSNRAFVPTKLLLSEKTQTPQQDAENKYVWYYGAEAGVKKDNNNMISSAIYAISKTGEIQIWKRSGGAADQSSEVSVAGDNGQQDPNKNVYGNASVRAIIDLGALAEKTS